MPYATSAVMPLTVGSNKDSNYDNDSSKSEQLSEICCERIAGSKTTGIFDLGKDLGLGDSSDIGDVGGGGKDGGGHDPLLAHCCVHPPLLPPPAIVTKKSLRHCMPHCERIMSSIPLLLSALLSFHCAGWLLPNTLPLLLASLPLLCPCQRPCCTGIIAIVALASLPSLPPTLPSSIAAVERIFAVHPSFC